MRKMAEKNSSAPLFPSPKIAETVETLGVHLPARLGSRMFLSTQIGKQ
jgi:hypothetical protein